MALWVPREKNPCDVRGKPKVKPASIVIYKATQYDVCVYVCELLPVCFVLLRAWFCHLHCGLLSIPVLLEAKVLPTVSLGTRAGTFWGG